MKSINDTYGYTLGDEILVSVSRCIVQSLPSDSIMDRLGYTIYNKEENEMIKESI